MLNQLSPLFSLKLRSNQIHNEKYRPNETSLVSGWVSASFPGWALPGFVQSDPKGWKVWFQPFGMILKTYEVFRRFSFLFKFLAFDFCWIFQLQLSPVSMFWFIPHNPGNSERKWKKPAVLKVSDWVNSASSAQGPGSEVQRRFRVHGRGCGVRGKPRAWSEVIRRRFWQCPGCRRWPGCCVGCRVWGQAMGGGSRQACWREVWECWWWQRWNLVPRSSASGGPSERSDWNDWGEKKKHVLF